MDLTGHLSNPPPPVRELLGLARVLGASDVASVFCGRLSNLGTLSATRMALTTTGWSK